MLIFSIIIYIILWLIEHAAFIVIGNSANLPLVIFLVPLQFAFSILIIIILLNLIDVYMGNIKNKLRALLILRGTRWLSFLTLLIPLAILIYSTIVYQQLPEAMIWAYFLPTWAVVILNLLEFEIYPSKLKENGQPALIVMSESTPSLIPEKETADNIVKTYNWTYNNRDYSIAVAIRKHILDEYRKKQRVEYDKWALEYVANGITGEVHELARLLSRETRAVGTREDVEFLLSFIKQAIKYQNEDFEYPKYPIETLVDQTGDCKDFSILGAAILKCLGYDVALLHFKDHAALGIAGAEGLPGSNIIIDGKRYYYCEMIGSEWRFGELPEGYRIGDAIVNPIPDWSTKIVYS